MQVLPPIFSAIFSHKNARTRFIRGPEPGDDDNQERQRRREIWTVCIKNREKRSHVIIVYSTCL